MCCRPVTLATDGLILYNEIENTSLQCSLKSHYSSSNLSRCQTGYSCNAFSHAGVMPHACSDVDGTTSHMYLLLCMICDMECIKSTF